MNVIGKQNEKMPVLVAYARLYTTTGVHPESANLGALFCRRKPETTIGELRRWLDLAAEKIPEEFKDTARVEFDCQSELVDGRSVGEDLRICVVYERPETDAEFAVRSEQNSKFMERVRGRELAELERLKKRHGGSEH